MWGRIRWIYDTRVSLDGCTSDHDGAFVLMSGQKGRGYILGRGLDWMAGKRTTELLRDGVSIVVGESCYYGHGVE